MIPLWNWKVPLTPGDPQRTPGGTPTSRVSSPGWVPVAQLSPPLAEWAEWAEGADWARDPGVPWEPLPVLFRPKMWRRPKHGVVSMLRHPHKGRVFFLSSLSVIAHGSQRNQTLPPRIGPLRGGCLKKKGELWANPPRLLHPNFVALGLDVRTLMFCQLMFLFPH